MTREEGPLRRVFLYRSSTLCGLNTMTGTFGAPVAGSILTGLALGRGLGFGVRSVEDGFFFGTAMLVSLSVGLRCCLPGASRFDGLAKPVSPLPDGHRIQSRWQSGPFEARTLLVVLVAATITDQSAVGLFSVDAVLRGARLRY